MAFGVLAGVAALAAPLRAQAQALVTPAETGPWTKQVQVDLFASLSYVYNANHPASDLNQYRVFDFGADKAKLDVAELVVQKAAAKPNDFGFRLDLVAGQSIPRVEAASGLFRDPDTGEADKNYDIQQAFVSWVAPVGTGLKVDAGKFLTYMGYETIETFDVTNDNHSRSLLFGYALPGTHTGLRLGYTFGPHLSGQLHLVQGWDNVRDNNSSLSVGAGLTWTPASSLSVTVNAMSGPEQKDNNRNLREIYDLYATWKVTNRIGLGVNADYGHETAALGPGRDAIWSGMALYATYAFTDRFALALRAERFDDRDGARTGVAQTLKEITLTPSYKFGTHFLLRGDLRQDRSDQRTFQKGNGFTDRQLTASLNLLLIY